MSLKERLKKLESDAAATKLDWNRICADTALILTALNAGEPWESLSAKVSTQSIEFLQLTAEYWQRCLDEAKATYEKTFGPGSYEANRAREA